ncbi:hypothetical protein ELQ92_00900 [Labedella populi]|uniref:Uncharacterized protein n=1 Tax=Labedella populi TaxID=2498850 RepID=A0A3S4A1W3_9MICO|nr:hypothetical protein [Labedella populi]RWZ67861.1 hypothetical protein ELQ92_00900 [Labedella populi]
MIERSPDAGSHLIRYRAVVRGIAIARQRPPRLDREPTRAAVELVEDGEVRVKELQALMYRLFGFYPVVHPVAHPATVSRPVREEAAEFPGQKP